MKSLVCILIGFLILTSIQSAVPLPSQQTSSSVLYVGGSGQGNFSSISEALESALNGDTIFVYPGTYYENLIINVSVHLRGIEGRDQTIVDANFSSLPLRVFADSCTIEGFSFQNGGDLGYNYTAAVSIRADYCLFTNNTVSMRDADQIHADSAIELLGNNSEISYCLLLENDYNPLIQKGIYISYYSKSCFVHHNFIEGFASGVNSEYFTSGVIIENNTIVSCNLGVSAYGSAVRIVHNTISDCPGFGLYVSAPNSYIAFNEVTCTDEEYSGGIMLYTSAKESVVEYNRVDGAQYHAIYLVDPQKCVVRRNDVLSSNIFVFKYLNTLWKKNEISENYYAVENLNSFGWQILPANLQILAYFESTWDIPWCAFDKNPASSPMVPN